MLPGLHNLDLATGMLAGGASLLVGLLGVWMCLQRRLIRWPPERAQARRPAAHFAVRAQRHSSGGRRNVESAQEVAEAMMAQLAEIHELPTTTG
jgi:hypothetical protein